MKKIFSKLALTAIALIVLIYGCNKNELNDNHSIIDQDDNPTLVKLKSEVENAQSFNDSLIIYQDSLTICTDSIMIVHCTDMVHHYDSMYHHSDSLCQIYENQLVLNLVS